MNLDDGPLDPFLGDPDDPAAVLDDGPEDHVAPPLTDEERDILRGYADEPR